MSRDRCGRQPCAEPSLSLLGGQLLRLRLHGLRLQRHSVGIGSGGDSCGYGVQSLECRGVRRSLPKRGPLKPGLDQTHVGRTPEDPTGRGRRQSREQPGTPAGMIDYARGDYKRRPQPAGPHAGSSPSTHTSRRAMASDREAFREPLSEPRQHLSAAHTRHDETSCRSVKSTEQAHTHTDTTPCRTCMRAC